MSSTIQEKPSLPPPSLVYSYEGGLYVNLTRQCPTACRFCIKFSWDYMYRGHNLKLPGEPSREEMMHAVDEAGPLSTFEEVIFCGYGESTYRLDDMKELTGLFRDKGARRVRLNTVGLGNLIHGRDIAPDLGKFLDAVSISLNTVDPAQWLEMMRPLPAFREKGLSSVLEFIASCARAVPQTTVTAVAMVGVDVAGVRQAAESRGAEFRLRPHLDNYEEK
jgi:TatD DNase family protein